MMAADQDVKCYDSFRQSILDNINSNFQRRVNEEIKDFSKDKQVPRDIEKDVSAKFQQTFSNYLATAFDIVIGNEILSNLSQNEKDDKQKEGSNDTDDQHDMSVTNEQLQEMDNSVLKVARRRKEYPKKCTKFLEKTLECQGKAAEKITVSVNSVEPLKDSEVQENSTNCNDLQEKLNELQSSVRKQIQKSVRIESSLRILGETESYEKKSQDD